MDYDVFIQQALQEASKIAVRHFGNVSSWVKGGDKQTILTDADLEISKLLVGRIEESFPDHNLLDEEAGTIDKASRFTWVIDPIDGTSNFAAGSPLYGIMIGLLENDQPVAGGFALPSFGEIYVASKGRGARLNGKPIHVTTEKDLGNVLVALGIHAKTQLEAVEIGRVTSALIREVTGLRSSASTFDMAMVAKGVYGAFASSNGKIWDCVGPHIVIEEAGGVFTHFDGSPIDYSDALKNGDKKFTYFMASPAIHERVLSAMRLGGK